MPQEQTTIRVGVPPSMLGQQGDTPIVVEIPSDTPPDQMRDAAMRAGVLKINSGGGQSVGFELPPSMAGGDASAILKAFPQIAGLVASFLPGARSAKMAFGVPAGAEVATQMVTGQELDPMSAIGQGTLGVVGHVVGATGRKIARGGENTVRRALNLRAPFDTRGAEFVIPKAAIHERASMTIPGVDAIKDKAARTGSRSLESLGEVLERARSESAHSPYIQEGIGTVGLLSHLVDPPKQLKIGEAMAAPFGVPGENIAQGSEGLLRTILAYLASLRGGVASEAPVEAPTRRRQ